MSASIQQLNATCITCHAWNKDQTKIAFCPNNNEVHIYKKVGNEWQMEVVLQEHDQVVMSIDWAPQTNRIVSCSQDRNAYVWHLDSDGQWKPTLVILRITRGATHVRWSPDEQKFAVSSGAKVVSVCHFEEQYNWWTSKHIKNHKSTVLSVAWHPNGIFLATGSSDFKTRIFSAFIKGVDKRPSGTPFGDKLPFGEMVAEYKANGWVHSVAWSPSGDWLGFVSHDSSVSFVNITQGPAATVHRLKLNYLPFRSMAFLSEHSAIAGGYDCNPALFSFDGSSWSFAKFVDQAPSGTAGSGESRSAMDMWQKKADLGTTVNKTDLDTKHQNAINCVNRFGSGPRVTKCSTTGVDGKLIIWDLASLNIK